jgi:hypothetical protein
MNGNDCWELLRHLREIFGKLKTKMVEMDLSAEFATLERKFLPRFDALAGIARYGRKVCFLSAEEIESFCAACTAYGVAVRQDGGLLSAPKEHSTEDHCPKTMRQFKTLYLFSEECDEATHHEHKKASIQTRSMRDPIAKARAALRIFERKQSSV